MFDTLHLRKAEAAKQFKKQFTCSEDHRVQSKKHFMFTLLKHAEIVPPKSGLPQAIQLVEKALYMKSFS